MKGCSGVAKGSKPFKPYNALPLRACDRTASTVLISPLMQSNCSLICTCSIGIVAEPLARRMGVPAMKQLVATEKKCTY